MSEPPRTRGLSPARIYLLTFGLFMVLGSAAELLFSKASFSLGAEALRNRDVQFDAFSTNGWHAVAELGAGVAFLLRARSEKTARSGALRFGVFFMVFTAVGFAFARSGVLLGFLVENTPTNLVHLVLGVAGVSSWALTRARDERRPMNAGHRSLSEIHRRQRDARDRSPGLGQDV